MALNTIALTLYLLIETCVNFYHYFSIGCLFIIIVEPGWLNELGRWIYKPITNTACVRPRLCELQKGCTRLAAASDKVYQLLAQGRWFSPGTPASCTTKTTRNDIAEILLKVALKRQKSNRINHYHCH